jgi:hypothetical protein
MTTPAPRITPAGGAPPSGAPTPDAAAAALGAGRLSRSPPPRPSKRPREEAAAAAAAGDATVPPAADDADASAGVRGIAAELHAAAAAAAADDQNCLTAPLAGTPSAGGPASASRDDAAAAAAFAAFNAAAGFGGTEGAAASATGAATAALPSSSPSSAFTAYGAAAAARPLPAPAAAAAAPTAASRASLAAAPSPPITEPPVSPPAVGGLLTPLPALLSGLCGRWPGRDDTVRQLLWPRQGLCELPPHALLVGRPGSGKSRFMADAYASAGLLAVQVPCGGTVGGSGGSVRNGGASVVRPLLEATLAATATATLEWARRYACAQVAASLGVAAELVTAAVPRAAVVEALLSSLCARGGEGVPCAAALVRWGDDATGALRAAYIAAMQRLEAEAEAAAAAGDADAVGGARPQYARTPMSEIAAAVGERRCGALDVFQRDMRALTSVTLGDVAAVRRRAHSEAACGGGSLAAGTYGAGREPRRERGRLVTLHLLLDDAERLLPMGGRALLLQLLQLGSKVRG